MEKWNLENEILKMENQRLRALLAEAAYQNPDAAWAKHAKELIPDLEQYYTPPCPGEFDVPPRCDDMHLHGLKCGDPADVCKLCGRTNAEHRKERGLV